RLPYRRAEPFIAAGTVDRAARRIADHLVDRPGLAIGSAQRPVAPRCIALQNEGALLRADQHDDLPGHAASLTDPPSPRPGPDVELLDRYVDIKICVKHRHAIPSRGDPP